MKIYEKKRIIEWLKGNRKLREVSKVKKEIENFTGFTNFNYEIKGKTISIKAIEEIPEPTKREINKIIKDMKEEGWNFEIKKIVFEWNKEVKINKREIDKLIKKSKNIKEFLEKFFLKLVYF